MKLGGKVYIDEVEKGKFLIDSDDQIIVEIDAVRWTAESIFQWALENHHTVRFEPMAEHAA